MTKEFVAELETLVGGMGNAWPKDVTIDCKRFFSGAAAYAKGRIFMSLTPAGLAVKLAEPDNEALMRMGGTPLRYFPKAPVKKAYVVVPENLAANTDLLKPWLARERSLRGGSLRQFFTGIKERLERISPTKPLIIKKPATRDTRG